MAVLIFFFQMDPSRISKEDAHCVRMLFRSQESIDLQDMPFENQEVKLMPESCRRMKQALQRAVQKVSGRQCFPLFPTLGKSSSVQFLHTEVRLLCLIDI